jgi:beta-N-acetylhexosaminidase
VTIRRTPAQRRRLAALAAAAVLALVLGAVAGRGPGGGEEGRAAHAPAAPAAREDAAAGAAPAPPAAVAELTPLQRAGQCVLLRFAGPAAPGYVLRALRERRAAGVVLFGDNVDSPAQLRALTRELQAAAGGRALVATDQEGGAVRNVPWAGPERAAPTIADPAEAEAIAEAAARDLRAAGITVNLAPVADLAGPVLGGRAFPGDADAVAALVAATVRGSARGGVLTTAKHFPGLGAATTNTDDAAATIAGVPDLAPFAAAVEAEVPLVMAAHARYPAIDPARIASQSRPVLTGLLRERLGFDGVVVTDSLEAEAVVGRSSTPTAAVRALRAGADLMLTTGRGSYRPVLDRLAAEARRDPAFARRLDASAARVRALTED